MSTTVLSATPWGVDARLVKITADLGHGMSRFELQGLPGTSARESRERIRSAIRRGGFEWPPRSTSVRLDPIDQPKDAPPLDLAIAAACLAALGEVPPTALEGHLLCGELDFDGRLRPVRGAISIAETAARQGARAVLVPARNAAEAAALDALPVLAVRSLGELVAHFRGVARIAPVESPVPARGLSASVPDFRELRGNEAAKRALEVAAAGGHHLLMVGPPGSGKTMLARRLPGILPPLALRRAIELTKIASSVAAEPVRGLVMNPPFRSPHPSVSTAGMTGGGRWPRPGETTLAHGGVLFLDELCEFRRDTLAILRQVLDRDEITLVRTHYRFEMPAKFTLVAAINACPCGADRHPERSCRCSPRLIERYRSRIPEFLLERIDLHVEVLPPSQRDLRGRPGECSAEIAARVLAAREIQKRRFEPRSSRVTNAAMTPGELARHCPLDDPARRLLERTNPSLRFDPRARARVLRVARTIADLDGRDPIGPAHLAEAIHYRPLTIPAARSGSSKAARASHRESPTL